MCETTPIINGGGARRSTRYEGTTESNEELFKRLTSDAGLPSRRLTSCFTWLKRMLVWYVPALLTIGSFIWDEHTAYMKAHVPIAGCYASSNSTLACTSENIDNFLPVSVSVCSFAFDTCQMEVDYTSGFFKTGGTLLGISICLYGLYLLFRSLQNQRMATFLLSCGVVLQNDSQTTDQVLIIVFCALIIVYAAGRAWYYESAQASCIQSHSACFCATPEDPSSPVITFLSVFITVVLIWRSSVFEMWKSIENMYTSIPMQCLFDPTAEYDSLLVISRLQEKTKYRAKRCALLRTMVRMRKSRLAWVFATEPTPDEILKSDSTNLSEAETV